MRIQRIIYRRLHEAENKKKHLELMVKAIDNITDPLEQHRSFGKINVKNETTTQYLWEYQRPFVGVEIIFFMMLPLLVGKVMDKVLASCRPAVKKARKQYTEHPHVPLTFLQGSKEEFHIKGPKKNEMSWICTEFLVCGDEMEIVNNFLHYSLCRPKPVLKEDRWKLVKILAKTKIWHLQSQRRLAAGRPFDITKADYMPAKWKKSRYSFYDEV